MRLSVKVITRASANRVGEKLGTRLKVYVTAPPERGRANELVVETVAAHFGVPRRQVRIVTGHLAALKELEVDGVDDVREST